MNHLQRVLRDVHEETLTRSEQLVQAHRQDTQAQNELASSARSSLESFLYGDMVKLLQDVGTFDSSLVMFSYVLGLIWY